MRKLKVKPAAGLNLSSHWSRYMKPFFDTAAFQARIDARVGLNKDGKSIIRLVWGQDIDDTSFGEVVPRYWTKRQRVATEDASHGKWLYWRVPRWILERRIEIEQYGPAWEASRYAMQDERGISMDKGECPRDYYVFAHLIAEHEEIDGSGWAACCTRAYYTDRSRCWGKYRQPGEFELQLISQAVRQMEADKTRDPYRPLTPAELAEIEVMAGMQVERQAEQERQMALEAAADFYGLPISAIPENYGRRESGLIVPN